MSSLLHVWQGRYPWEVRVGKINRTLLAAGWKVTVASRRGEDEPAQESLDGIDIMRVGTPASGRLRVTSLPVPGNPVWARALNRITAQSRPDVVLVRDIPLAITAAAAARRHGAKFVIDMAEHYPAAMRSWKKYSESILGRLAVHTLRVPDMVERAAVAAADGIVVVCEEMRERLVCEYGIPEEKVCVARNTPELPLPAVNAAPSAAPGDRSRFGYFGILCQDRQLDVVLRGFDQALRSDPALSLLVAGAGESEETLKRLASGLAARDRIRFTGRFSPEQLPELLASVDFGVVALEANEFTEHTMANKFFDYSARGMPFLYPDLRPPRRVMASMNCGEPYKPGDAASVTDGMLFLRERLGRNELAYADAGARGRRAVEAEFNWGKDGGRLRGFLQRIASSR